jgi:hypothetical protein
MRIIDKIDPVTKINRTVPTREGKTYEIELSRQTAHFWDKTMV